MNNVIYQQDGAPPHCSNVSLDFLNEYFPGDRLISRRTNNPWPACCAHVLIEWFGNTPGANKGDWLQRNALGTRISNSAS